MQVANRTKEEIAYLALAVEEAAAVKDKPAVGILCRAGAELADLACGVLSQIQCGTTPRVFVSGSVLRNSRLVRGAFDETLKVLYPGAQIALARHSPEIGAALLLMDRLRAGAEPDLRAR